MSFEVNRIRNLIGKLARAQAATGITRTTARGISRILQQDRNVQGVAIILREEGQEPFLPIALGPAEAFLRGMVPVKPVRMEDLALSLPVTPVPGITDLSLQPGEYILGGEEDFSEKDAAALIEAFHQLPFLSGNDKASRSIHKYFPTHSQHFNLSVRLRIGKIREKLRELGITSVAQIPQDKLNDLALFIFDIKNDHSAFFHSPALFQIFEELFTADFASFLSRRKGNEKYRILDVGPGLGEESSTLAMLIVKAMVEHFAEWKINNPSDYVEIIAVDHLYEPPILQLVERGIYPPFIREEIPDDIYWQLIIYRLLFAGEKSYEVSPAAKGFIQYKRIDLFNPQEAASVIVFGSYHMVFCLKVLERILIRAEELKSTSHQKQAKNIFDAVEKGTLLVPRGYYFGDDKKRRAMLNRLGLSVNFTYPYVNPSIFEPHHDFSDDRISEGAIFRIRAAPSPP